MTHPMHHSKITPSLPGFGHIKRHWNEAHNSIIAVIEPGQFYVTNKPELIMTTLGSCISACIRDPISAIGGMNHFMLPAKGSIYSNNKAEIDGSMRYGNWAMEFLINEILKNGGKRRNLEVKIFGGGGTLNNTAVCALNIKFIEEYVHDENLKLSAKDVGGHEARNLLYNAMSGKVMMKKLKTESKQLIEAERTYSRSIQSNDDGNDAELF